MTTTAELRASLWRVAASGLLLVWLIACNKKEQAREQTGVGPGAPVHILASSELMELAHLLEASAQRAGVRVQFSYAGSVDIVDRVNGGEAFDAVLPANGAYASLAMKQPPLAREKLFYSKVALGVKQEKLRELGWDNVAPTWADVAAAVRASKLRYAMTSPSSSNTGMSALFAVACAAAGKNEDLTLADIRAPENVRTVKDFVSGQKLSAGSSGFLSTAYLRDQATLDAIVNYEAVILRMNQQPELREKLAIVYPKDGVISADYPLLLLNESSRPAYRKLVVAWRDLAFQSSALATYFLRPTHPDAAPASALPRTDVAEIGFPNNLEVIDAVLSSYHAAWRRPATSIFVLDTSGSMQGRRLTDLQSALKVLSGADTTSLSARYGRFQSRERVVFIPFANSALEVVRFQYSQNEKEVSEVPSDENAAVNANIRAFAEALSVDGGTAIYTALIAAYDEARTELKAEPDRVVTIVLLTDGENNQGVPAVSFESVVAAGPRVRVFPILFGEASADDMAKIADLTGGRVFNGLSGSLSAAFKEIRGYQ
jgi:Ca-activated chloride channel family protein